MRTFNLNLTLPKAWHELDDGQLTLVFQLLAQGLSADQIKAACLLQWGGMKLLYMDGGSATLQKGEDTFCLTTHQLHAAANSLAWMDELPHIPVRVSEFKTQNAIGTIASTAKGLAADFAGVPLQSFIMADNLYQGYLHTQKSQLLQQLAGVLYPGFHGTLAKWQEVAVFYWMASLKDWLSHRFSDFFRPAADQSGNLLGDARPLGLRIQQSVDAMLRALTKGDVTKEQQVLELDTLRALTELNAQAREADEIRRQFPSK